MPFPGYHGPGRVCVKPCETGCNRNHIDNTINIHAVERYIGDEAIRQNWPIQYVAYTTHKRVLVIGAGPSGLSAAYHLARMGHTVEIYEAGKEAGGLLRTGIPDYRLPKDILDAEIERIKNLEVKIVLNRKVDDVLAEKQAGHFDAVYVSIGAQLIHEEEFKHDNSVHITDAFSFFERSKTDPAPFTKKKVMVYGGGKLALYISRITKRFGSDTAVYFYGDNKMMPAYDYETEDALAEGVDVKLYRSISRIENKKVILEIMKTEKGKAVGTGEFEIVEADVLINANKQETDSGFLRSVSNIKINDDGTVITDAQRMTGSEGIFAGGDMLPGENRSATIAIGHGKKAAGYINGYLMQKPYQKQNIKPPVIKNCTCGTKPMRRKRNRINWLLLLLLKVLMK